MDIDTAGIQELVLYLINWLVTGFDIRTIDTETVAQLLTTFSGIWNPIWEAVNNALGNLFNF